MKVPLKLAVMSYGKLIKT